jgi:hypothetical protein
MELKNFTDKVCDAARKRFGDEARIEIKEVPKNNGVVLHGLLIASENVNVIPTIYLDSFWEAYEGGVAFGEIMERIFAVYEQETCKKSIDLAFFRDFSRVKDRICYRLVGREANEELLKDVPHLNYLDLAVCFFYAYSGGEIGEGSILIHNSHMEMWQTSTPELLELAEENTPRLYPGQISFMGEVLDGFLSEEPSEPILDEEEYRGFLEQVPMKIMSNTRKVNGATSLLYDKLLDNAAEGYGGSFYVIPSSVHEVILLPDSGKESASELKMMIHDVNRTQLSPEEVLSDNLYYYDNTEKKLKIVCE